MLEWQIISIITEYSDSGISTENKNMITKCQFISTYHIGCQCLIIFKPVLL